MEGKFKPHLGSQLFVSLLFIVVLVIPIVKQRAAESVPEKKNISEARSYSMEMFGFFLNQVNDDLAADFVHKAPQLDSRLEHIMPTIASIGASVSIVDFNHDGWNDIYLTSSRHNTSNALYKNSGNGNFVEVADELGVGSINEPGQGVSMGSIWADINNDGYEDLFVYKWGRPRLFINEGGERFIDITEGSGLPDWLNANAAVWLDFNKDGWIDLCIGGYYKEDIDLWQLDNTLIMPESFEYANNGGRNYLLENMGNGKFRDVASEKGLSSTKWTLALGAMDFDNNGMQDIFIANDYSVDELYLNFGDAGFKEVGKESKIGYAPKSGMNVSVADIKNDGNFSVYVSNITEMGILLQGNNMWVPEGNSGQLTYSNKAGIMGIELGGWSYGAQFGDLNNDGFQDLYLANGYISATKNNSYWYDYSKVTGGNKAIISDALNWPAMEGRSQSGFQENKIWVNSNAGIFADVTSYASNVPTYDSRAVALVDLWNDGTLDVVVANQGKEFSLLKNDVTNEHNWIAFELEGKVSNRSAIGSKLTLEWGGQSQSKVVHGGIGFSSQNQRSVHFGIGKSSTVSKLRILWPSGIEQVIDGPKINQKHIIIELNETS